MTQLTVIQNNSSNAMKTGSDDDKSTELSKMLKEHLKNPPKEDNARDRDTEIAQMQNKAAVAEKNIRKLTQEIEELQRERTGLKNDRQEKYEAMNSANNVLQGKKQEKDEVFQRLRRTQAGANALKVGRGRNKESFRSIAELDAQIRRTERRMQTEVLSLREEKATIRQLADYRKMRPEVQKMQAKYAALNDYKESNKDQEEVDRQEYARLKGEVERAYKFQQSQYELFRVAMEADQQLNDSITAAMQQRRNLYDSQKQTRGDIVTRRRDFQKSARQAQQWQMRKRRLQDDIQRAKRSEQRLERDGRIARERSERRARQQAYAEEAAAERESETRGGEEEKTDAERPAADSKPAVRTTRPTPRARAPRPVYVHRQRDPLERQNEQLAAVETYVRSLVPQADGSAASSEAAPAPTESRKGIFKPSRESEAPKSVTDDLFKSTKKGKKSKRKRNKKAKQVLLVQHPANVTVSMDAVGQWLSSRSCPLEFALPVRKTDAAKCLETLAEVRAWMLEYVEEQAREPEQVEEVAEAPVEADAEVVDQDASSGDDKADEPVTQDEAQESEMGQDEHQDQEDDQEESDHAAESDASVEKLVQEEQAEETVADLLDKVVDSDNEHTEDIDLQLMYQ